MSREGPIKVLNECIELMQKKAADYNNPNSSVRQAMYYPDGVKTITDILWAKILRLRSLCESEDTPKNESLRDTFLDIVNYASFGAAWIDGKIEGQGSVDAFNKPHQVKQEVEHWIPQRSRLLSEQELTDMHHRNARNTAHFAYYVLGHQDPKPRYKQGDPQPDVEWPEPEADFAKNEDVLRDVLTDIRTGKI